MNASSFGFSLFLQLQNIFAHPAETVFGGIAEKRILVIVHGRGDSLPVCRLERLERSREKLSILHHHMVALVRDELANEVANILPKALAIREYELDRFSYLAQAVCAPSVLAGQIAHAFDRRRIANLEFGIHQILLRMMVYLGVDREVADDRTDDFVVGAFASIEDLKLSLEDGK